MKKITGLFEGKTKNGDLCLSGKIGGKSVGVFRNTFRKEGTRQPEWILYELDENKDKQDNSLNVEKPLIQDEDIPF